MAYVTLPAQKLQLYTYIIATLLLLALPVPAQQQAYNPTGGQTFGPVEEMPACDSTQRGRVWEVTDAIDGDDCTVGEQSSFNACQCNGTNWVDYSSAGTPVEADTISTVSQRGSIYNQATDEDKWGIGGANATKCIWEDNGDVFFQTCDETCGNCVYETRGVTLMFGNGTDAITTDEPIQQFEVPYALSITGWTATCTTSGSIAYAIAIESYVDYDASFTSVVASDAPAISGAKKAQDLAPTGWTTDFTVGDILRVTISSADTVVRCFLHLRWNVLP